MERVNLTGLRFLAIVAIATCGWENIFAQAINGQPTLLRNQITRSAIQNRVDDTSTPAKATRERLVGSTQDDSPIEDNSFSFEEAYNQEIRVVQHIFNFDRATDGSSWITTFTQEWPALGQKHQLS